MYPSAIVELCGLLWLLWLGCEAGGDKADGVVRQGRLGDDFDGVAVGVGDGGEEGAGGGAQGLTEDGHAGGCKSPDEGADGVFAADGKCEVCVSAG